MRRAWGRSRPCWWTDGSRLPRPLDASNGGCAGWKPVVTLPWRFGGSAGRRTPGGERLAQVVPGTGAADLDDVAARGGVGRGHPHARVDRPHPAVVRAEAVAVHVGEQDELVLAADRAVDPRRLADVLGGAHQLRVSVAQLVDRVEPDLRVAEQGALRERVVDHVELRPPG